MQTTNGERFEEGDDGCEPCATCGETHEHAPWCANERELQMERDAKVADFYRGDR